MGKLGLAMKNRAHLTPAVQMFVEYLPFREMAGRRMPVNERGRAVLLFGSRYGSIRVTNRNLTTTISKMEELPCDWMGMAYL